MTVFFLQCLEAKHIEKNAVALTDMNSPYRGTGMGRCQSGEMHVGPLQWGGEAPSFLDGW